MWRLVTGLVTVTPSVCFELVGPAGLLGSESLCVFYSSKKAQNSENWGSLYFHRNIY